MRAEIDHYFANALSLRSDLKKLERSRDSNTIKFRSSYSRVSISYYDQAKVRLEQQLEAEDPGAANISVGFVMLLDQVIRQLKDRRHFTKVSKEEGKAAARHFFKAMYVASLWCLCSSGREIVPVNCEKLKDHRRPFIRALKKIRYNVRKVTFHNKLEAIRFFESYVSDEARKEWEAMLK